MMGGWTTNGPTLSDLRRVVVMTSILALIEGENNGTVNTSSPLLFRGGYKWLGS
ncbi:hypothetical protein ANO14919_079930 [Xylariales sp. No.14919]|nr:hypothetical protein ANO14919_079930 [Xylariales sp. No.14919]